MMRAALKGGTLMCFLVTAACANAPELSLRPLLRSKEAVSMEGAVCGDPALKGEVVGRVPGKLNGCGVENAVRLQVVSGVALSQRAVMDCTTANALKTWVNEGLKPAFADIGGGAVKLRVAAHYACRTRNNKRGAKISEHGKGRAIDLSGVWTANGDEYSILRDYKRGKAGKALRAAHKAACGPFGTTLGPGSDGYHEDHLHFDTARYRSGSYCR